MALLLLSFALAVSAASSGTMSSSLHASGSPAPTAASSGTAAPIPTQSSKTSTLIASSNKVTSISDPKSISTSAQPLPEHITSTMTTEPPNVSIQDFTIFPVPSNTWLTTTAQGHSTIVPIIVPCSTCTPQIVWELPPVPGVTFKWPKFPELPPFSFPCINVFGMQVGDCPPPKPEGPPPSPKATQAPTKSPTSTNDAKSSTSTSNDHRSISSSSTCSVRTVTDASISCSASSCTTKTTLVTGCSVSASTTSVAACSILLDPFDPDQGSDASDGKPRSIGSEWQIYTPPGTSRTASSSRPASTASPSSSSKQSSTISKTSSFGTTSLACVHYPSILIPMRKAHCVCGGSTFSDISNNCPYTTMPSTTFDPSKFTMTPAQAPPPPPPTPHPTDSCEVQIRGFFDDFTIMGRNFDKDQLGDWGINLFNKLSDCGAVTAWQFGYYNNDPRYDWWATGHLPDFNHGCVGTAVEHIGGDRDKCQQGPI